MAVGERTDNEHERQSADAHGEESEAELPVVHGGRLFDRGQQRVPAPPEKTEGGECNDRRETLPAHGSASVTAHAPWKEWRGRNRTATRRIESGEGRNRTGDTTVFSRVLYRLSYLAAATKCSYPCFTCSRPGAPSSGA